MWHVQESHLSPLPDTGEKQRASGKKGSRKSAKKKKVVQKRKGDKEKKKVEEQYRGEMLMSLYCRESISTVSSLKRKAAVFSLKRNATKRLRFIF